MDKEKEIPDVIKSQLPKRIQEVEEGKFMSIDEARKKVFTGKKIRAELYDSKTGGYIKAEYDNEILFWKDLWEQSIDKLGESMNAHEQMMIKYLDEHKKVERLEKELSDLKTTQKSKNDFC